MGRQPGSGRLSGTRWWMRCREEADANPTRYYEPTTLGHPRRTSWVYFCHGPPRVPQVTPRKTFRCAIKKIIFNETRKTQTTANHDFVFGKVYRRYLIFLFQVVYE